MSTDDSISEDVSSSGALSHCHASADGDGGKESETSLLSSEGTSASGPAVSENRHTASQPKAGAVERRPVDITPACNKIRSLCLTTGEAFDGGRNLPFINPSPLETLRALVQEIQSSGETDPEVWKDCELVEKQYQEQILAQQEQYQCQIQLIQDEIKALVQLQNRPGSIQPHSEFSPTPVAQTPTNTKDYILPLLSRDGAALQNVVDGNDHLAAPDHTPFSSPSPPPPRPDGVTHQVEERATTMLSSGYGTLSTWESGRDPAGSPGEDEERRPGREQHQWPSHAQEEPDAAVMGSQRDNEKILRGGGAEPAVHQQRTSGTRQLLTSWAQRQKLKAKRSRAPSQISKSREAASSLREPLTQNLLQSPDSQDQQRPSEPPFPLRRTDSLMSEVSGLTYWRLTESELYHPLPDSFDSGAYLLLQEASMSPEPQLSLRDIYQNKQRSDCKRSDWGGSVLTSPSSARVLTLDPAASQRQSDRTSGFTSPSRFSSPSLANQPQLYPRVRTPVTPDSMVESTPHPGDTDAVSDISSVSASPSKVQNMWGLTSAAIPSTSQDKTRPRSHTSQEEGSHTHPSTLRPPPASGAGQRPAAGPHARRAAPVEDPVVLSLLRQNLREKNSRHVADLKAYYEAEIQTLRDKLQLRDLPRDLDTANRALTERCRRLEEVLAEAHRVIQELESVNNSLEKKLAEWPERYAVAGATVKSLHQRLEESRRSEEEKEALAARLKNHGRQLEEALQRARREGEEKEARRESEYKMLQDLLGEYDSVTKENVVLKNSLLSTEDRLLDASGQISDLKCFISKLESQVKQLEHQNQARTRSASHSNTKPSGAGLFHHPDLLPSPSKGRAEPHAMHRKSPCPPSDQTNGGRKSPFTLNQTGFLRSGVSDRASGGGSSADSAAGSCKCASPPECEQSPPPPREPELSSGQRDASRTLTPIMRALIQLEETRATESRAPWVNQRNKVGFVERKHKEAGQERVLQRSDIEVVTPRGGGGGARFQPGRAETAAAWLRAQRSLSPERHRSSSLPPPAQRNVPPTPTKRETLLTPLSAKSSPKRCPTENYSTAFGHPMPREEHLLQPTDGPADQRRHSFHSSRSRKRLQFSSADREDDSSGGRKLPEGNSQQGWEEPEREQGRDSCEDSTSPSLNGLASLAEAEKLLDELTQEKLQIEAALSRMPAGGARVSFQTRLDEVALEARLERLNRELGSIRMTLKRFRVLRSSSHV